MMPQVYRQPLGFSAAPGSPFPSSQPLKSLARASVPQRSHGQPVPRRPSLSSSLGGGVAQPPLRDPCVARSQSCLPAPLVPEVPEGRVQPERLQSAAVTTPVRRDSPSSVIEDVAHHCPATGSVGVSGRHSTLSAPLQTLGAGGSNTAAAALRPSEHPERHLYPAPSPARQSSSSQTNVLRTAGADTSAQTNGVRQLDEQGAAAIKTSAQTNAKNEAGTPLTNRVRQLETRLRELKLQNKDLEKTLYADGCQFLEALHKLENDCDNMRKDNAKLAEERAEKGGSAKDLQAAQTRKMQEVEDMRIEFSGFRQEKDEDLRQAQGELANISRELAQRRRHFEERRQQIERERSHVAQAMAEEGQELQLRITKASAEKEALGLELAHARVRADAAAASGCGLSRRTLSPVGNVGIASASDEADRQLKAVLNEQQVLKGEVAAKESQVALLKSQLEAIQGQLKDTDVENERIKRELQTLRRTSVQDAPRSGTSFHATTSEPRDVDLASTIARPLGATTGMTPSALASSSTDAPRPSPRQVGGMAIGVSSSNSATGASSNTVSSIRAITGMKSGYGTAGVAPATSSSGFLASQMGFRDGMELGRPVLVMAGKAL